MRCPGFVAALAVAALAAAAPSRSQGRFPNGPLQVPPGQLAPQTPAKPPQQRTPLKVRVNVVRLPVTVRDNHGNLVLDLGPEDFEIYDNGSLEHIESFNVGGNPVSAVLVLENSSRVAALLPGVLKTGIIFTNVVMGGNGQGSLLTFNDAPQVVVPFTGNQDRLEKAIARLKPGDSGAHLYDALNRAVEMLEAQPDGRRRIIVVVSESLDTGSLAKLGSVLRDAQLANITIFSIGLSTTAAELRASAEQYSPPEASPPGTFTRPGIPGSPQTPTTMSEASGNMDLLALVERLVKLGVNLISPQALQAASTATGGDHISTFRDSAIEQAMNRIGSELHGEYTLAYQAPANGRWGYHTITVRVSRPGYRVRTRPGYFLAPPEGSTSSGS